MTRRAYAFLLLGIVALAGSSVPLCAEVVAGDEVPAAIAEAALAYSSAMLDSDPTTSWNLLSSRSRSELTAVQWEEAVRSRRTARPPSPQTLLKALAITEEPVEVGELLLSPDQALVAASERVQITQELILVKEGDRWLVDLSASDEMNARAAAQLFLDAVRAEIQATSGGRPSGSPAAHIPMFQMMLASNARDYYVLEGDIQGDRAHVTLACDLPVSVVFQASRLGAGWQVDTSRPVVTVDPTSSDPLRAAMDSTHKQMCQEQLQKLSRAFQMYASASDDLLPDPDRWVDLVRPFGSGGLSLHCPADQSPGITYAMNGNLAGKRRSRIANASLTPLLFESTLHTANPSDTGESWPEPALHSDGNLVLYVDGSIRPMKHKPSFGVVEGEARSAPVQRQPRAMPPAGRLLPR